jgi:hypothetical protein
MSRAFAAIAVSLVLATVLAGCGDEGSASATLTASEWRREANAVCHDIGPRVGAVPQPEVLDAILPFTSEVIPLWKDEEDRIRALAHPSEVAENAEALADALAELNVSLLEIHIATQRNDGTRREGGIERGQAAAQSIKRSSRELGLAACAAQRIP